MAFVITSLCIGEKSAECTEVCPVDCIEEGEEMYYIDPASCIDCGACASICPVEAIFDEAEIPKKEHVFIERNHVFFK